METQVSAWRPDGSLVFVIGRKGEGPGEFTRPSQIYLAEDGGFTVREGWGSRFTHYTATGDLVGTEIGLTTSLTYQDARLGLHAPTADGGYLAIPLFGASLQAGLYGGPPMEQEPLLHVRRSESGEWLRPESIFSKNIRNGVGHVPVEHMDGHVHFPQYFGDADHTAFAHGKILVMQRAGGPPGSLDLLELSADGDTLWERRLQFEPLKLTPEWIQEVVEKFTGPEFQFSMFSRSEQLNYVKAFEETLYKPGYLPAARCDGHPRLGDPGRSPGCALRGRAETEAREGTVSLPEALSHARTATKLGTFNGVAPGSQPPNPRE